MKEFAYTMPDQKELYPYKQQATMIIGYMYGFGTLLLLTGEVLAAFILIIPHVLVATIQNGPTFAKTQTVWGTAEQAWLFDLAILFSLFMVLGSKLSIDEMFGSGKKKQGKKTNAAEESE